ARTSFFENYIETFGTKMESIRLGGLHEFLTRHLLKAETVQEQASKIGVNLKLTNIPLEDPLFHIRKQIETSGFPVLTAIDHQIFSGHAIVVDKITDTHTTIRDPYSGEAWEIPNEEITSYYCSQEEEEEVEEAEQQKCLSVMRA
ncbi:MAG: hypothetical protein KR126chlam3_01580, partial [Chlamydiae bacterium]|nr:hypothetical protein [Chlamydiota bacterium]